MKLKKRFKWLPMLMGLVMLVLGIALFIKPTAIANRIPLFLGSVLVFIGLDDLLYSFLTKDYKIGTSMQLIQGTINVMIGLVFLLKQDTSLLYLGICFGFCAIVMGAIKLNLAVDHYYLGEHYGWYIFDGIIRIIFAGFLIFNPVGGFTVWTMTCGAYFIISAIDILIASIVVEKLFYN